MDKIKVPLPPSKYYVPDKKFNRFVYSTIILLVFVLIEALLIYQVFFMKEFNPIYFFLFIFIIFILSGTFVYWLVVTILSRIPKRINKAVKTKLTQNFLIADFWLPQKRKIEVVVTIEKDNTFKHGKGRYIVDEECIWFDEDNFPHSNYIPNLPNPLKYDFRTLFNRLSDLMRKGIFYLKTKKGETVDIIYSSEGLETFRKDKFLHDLHTETNSNEQKLIYVLIGVLTIIVILAFVFLNAKNKPVEQVTQTGKATIMIGGLIWQNLKRKKQYR